MVTTAVAVVEELAVGMASGILLALAEAVVKASRARELGGRGKAPRTELRQVEAKMMNRMRFVNEPRLRCRCDESE